LLVWIEESATMEINKHITFRADDDKKLIRYLRENGIPFDEGEIISAVDILESNPHWEFISNYIRKKDILCQSETIFSKDELMSAEWLTVYSMWRCGYPQPESNFEYETITYSRQNYCKECSRGLVQVSPFRMKKAPKWGRRSFTELNWVGDELFINDRCKTVLENAGITGIGFGDVKDSKGIESYEDIHQLIVPTLLKKGMIENCSYIREFWVCQSCGTKKYISSGIGMPVFREESFENAPDVVKTAEVFGDGHYIARVIIVSQKVYRIIVENGLDRGLVFEPIQLVKDK
jgi:hypothetical protein